MCFGLTGEEYLARVGRGAATSRAGYGVGLREWANFHHDSADGLVARIKGGEMDVYKSLEQFTSYLQGKGLAPKTTRFYLTAVKGLLRYENLTVDDYQVRLKVGPPPNIESSLDKIPTREELRLLLLNAINPKTRALISLLATSGLRIGEASKLRIGNVDFEKRQITLMATRTKSRASRTTYISEETVKFLQDYLKERVKEKDGWLFPNTRNPSEPTPAGTTYQWIRRTLSKVGLRKKLDPDSCMYELHPHAFRKYFFTKLISAGVDRGVAEYLMGHKFGLDNNYLRMDEAHVRKEYEKAENDFTFLQDRNLAILGKESAREAVQEEVRRILREEYPQLVKELAKET